MRIDDGGERRRAGRTPRALDPGGAVSDATALRDDPLFGAAARPASRAGAAAYLGLGRDRRRARDPAARERAVLLANMEMWRWEPRDMGERRIEVNIPDLLRLGHGRRFGPDERRVVVGKPNTPTPVFSDRMRYVLINPSWRVPEFDRQEGDPAAPRSL